MQKMQLAGSTNAVTAYGDETHMRMEGARIVCLEDTTSALRIKIWNDGGKHILETPGL